MESPGSFLKCWCLGPTPESVILVLRGVAWALAFLKDRGDCDIDTHLGSAGLSSDGNSISFSMTGLDWCMSQDLVTEQRKYVSGGFGERLLPIAADHVWLGCVGCCSHMVACEELAEDGRRDERNPSHWRSCGATVLTNHETALPLNSPYVTY